MMELSGEPTYLPNAENALVEQGKIVDYLLSLTHEDGRSKAIFFRRFGFAPENWETFADALRAHGVNNPVAATSKTHFGARYTVEGELEGADGRRPLVRSVWQTDAGKDTPRLITAYPL